MSTTAGVSLLSNASATSAVKKWPGGRGWFCAGATWGGGNVVLQMLLPDGASWVNVHTALTANGGVAFELPPCSIRAAVTTATAVYARADRIPA
jgi:hypothetical protein